MRVARQVSSGCSVSPSSLKASTRSRRRRGDFAKASRVKRRRVVATWSLRLRAVCSLGARRRPRVRSRGARSPYGCPRRSAVAHEDASVELAPRCRRAPTSSCRPFVTRSSPACDQATHVCSRSHDVVCVEHVVERVALRKCPQSVASMDDVEPPAPERHGRSRRCVLRALASGPRLHAEAVDLDVALGVGVTERVGCVVGRESVVVQRWGLRRPTIAQETRRFEAQTNVTTDVSLGLGDERVEGLLERREPHPVVDELGPARLQTPLLVVTSRSSTRSSRSACAVMSASAAGHS